MFPEPFKFKYIIIHGERQTTTKTTTREKLYPVTNFSSVPLSASVFFFYLEIENPICEWNLWPQNYFRWNFLIKSALSLTWHCCGPCRVGDDVFGLDFFVVAVACGKLEFDDDEAAVTVVVAVNVVMVSGCTDIDATDVVDCVDDDFCCCAMLKAFADDSITFAIA